MRVCVCPLLQHSQLSIFQSFNLMTSTTLLINVLSATAYSSYFTLAFVISTLAWINLHYLFERPRPDYIAVMSARILQIVFIGLHLLDLCNYERIEYLYVWSLGGYSIAALLARTLIFKDKSCREHQGCQSPRVAQTTQGTSAASAASETIGTDESKESAPAVPAVSAIPAVPIVLAEAGITTAPPQSPPLPLPLPLYNLFWSTTEMVCHKIVLIAQETTVQSFFEYINKYSTELFEALWAPVVFFGVLPFWNDSLVFTRISYCALYTFIELSYAGSNTCSASASNAHAGNKFLKSLAFTIYLLVGIPCLGFSWQSILFVQIMLYMNYKGRFVATLSDSIDRWSRNSTCSIEPKKTL